MEGTKVVMWIFTIILLIALIGMSWLFLFSAASKAGGDSKLVRWAYKKNDDSSKNVTIKIRKPLAFALPIAAVLSMIVLIITGSTDKKVKEGFNRMML